MRALNRQFENRQSPYFLQVAGLNYTWDAARPAGDRVVEVLDAAGAPLDLHATFRICISSFFAQGG